MPRQDTDYSLCIICQAENGDSLVGSPSAYDKLLLSVRDRATYGDRDYPEINQRLGDATPKSLRERSASWHRKCHQNTVHAGMCSRAKVLYEKRLLCKGFQDATSYHEAPPFTRSKATPYKSDLCFFCDVGTTRTNPLHVLTIAQMLALL